LPEMIDMTGVEQATNGTHPVTGYCPEPQTPHWYAIYTSPRHEKRVHEHLFYRNVECFLPLYRTVHRWKNGCKPVVELPLFPGYLFVKIGQRLRVRVLEIPGVLSFVGNRAEPSQLSDFEIETLRSGLHLRKFAPYREVAIGEKVSIKTGPLNGLVGVLVRNTNGLRVVLTLDMINQSVAVELDAVDIEPIESRRPPMISDQPAALRS
jgi:transcription antitermination factor NusG